MDTNAKNGLITLLVSLALVAGWLWDLEGLKQVSPDYVSMKMNTAVGFCLSSCILIGYKFRIWRQSCAWVLFLLSILTLSQYVLNVNLGIDQLLVVDNTATLNTVSPGRMALSTAIAFFMLGLGRITDNKELERICLLTPALIGLLACVGYALDLPYLYHANGSTAMALHTSLLFALHAGAAYFTKDTRGT